MFDAPPDKDNAGRQRLALSRLFQLMKSVDLEAVIIPYKPKIRRPEEEGEELILCTRKDCLDYLSKLPRSITQLHKYFPKGKPKRDSNTICANCLIPRPEEKEDVLMDAKDGTSLHNVKISKQRAQHYDLAS